MRTAEHQAALSVWPRLYASGQSATAQDAALDRASSDKQAAWMRWSRPEIAQRFIPAERPWYECLEQARVETLAGQHLPGMRCNLAVTDGQAAADDPLSQLYQCARRVFESGELKQAQWQLADVPVGWKSHLAFWHTARRRRIEEALPTLLSAQLWLNDAERFAEALRPLIQACAQAYPQTGRKPASTAASQHAEARVRLGKPRPVEQAQSAMEDEQAYRIYSRVWDQLLTRRELAALAPAESFVPSAVRAEALQLAQQLRRRLQARRRACWDFDLHEGALDRRRLASLVSSGNRAVFRQEREVLHTQASVTLLLDLSGSMRGQPWQLTALAVDLAVQALEAASIRCEVLGYGTCWGVENPVYRAWQEAGSPSSPGRLNAVRHLIFKTADQPWRLCRGLLNREGIIGGDNIDGEALTWAAARLMKQAQPRKILLVISDGQPCDEATRLANGAAYLDRHLHRCIAEVERSPVHLAALGAGHGVSRFYLNSKTLSKSETIFPVLFDCLAELLDVERRPSA